MENLYIHVHIHVVHVYDHSLKLKFVCIQFTLWKKSTQLSDYSTHLIEKYYMGRSKKKNWQFV